MIDFIVRYPFFMASPPYDFDLKKHGGQFHITFRQTPPLLLPHINKSIFLAAKAMERPL
jgi:hypothetical protein